MTSRLNRLRAMQVFVRVAECGSFKRAAESLNLSNGTVTTLVAQFERHLGVTLIDRNTRRLRLTEEGQTYLRHVQEWLAQVVQSESELRSCDEKPRGLLRVEATISVEHALLSASLPEFLTRYPDITMAVSLSNQPHDLVERDIDAAIRVGHVERPGHVARLLCVSRYVLCCSPAMAITLPNHPRDLDPRACLGLYSAQRRQPRPWMLRRGSEELQIDPDGALHFNSSDNALAAARAGAGLVFVVNVLANLFLEDGSLVRVYPDWDSPTQSFHIETPSSKVQSTKVEAFVQFLYEVTERDRRLIRSKFTVSEEPPRRP